MPDLSSIPGSVAIEMLETLANEWSKQLRDENWLSESERRVLHNCLQQVLAINKQIAAMKEKYND